MQDWQGYLVEHWFPELIIAVVGGLFVTIFWAGGNWAISKLKPIVSDWFAARNKKSLEKKIRTLTLEKEQYEKFFAKDVEYNIKMIFELSELLWNGFYCIMSVLLLIGVFYVSYGHGNNIALDSGKNPILTSDTTFNNVYIKIPLVFMAFCFYFFFMWKFSSSKRKLLGFRYPSYSLFLLDRRIERLTKKRSS